MSDSDEAVDDTWSDEGPRQEENGIPDYMRSKPNTGREILDNDNSLALDSTIGGNFVHSSQIYDAK